MKNHLLKIIAISLFSWSFGAQAGIIYDVSRTVQSGSISGTIETDGTIGVLNQSNIISWTLDANDGTDTFTISSTTGGLLQGNAWSYLSATDTELSFDYDGALADTDANLIGFHGGDLSGSYDYNLTGDEFVGTQEQIIHQFGFGGQHWIQAEHTGVEVIGTSTIEDDDEVRRGLTSVHFGGPDICETFGLKPGCDGNYSGTAVMKKDGSVKGQVIDTWVGKGTGVHAAIDCLYVAGTDAWLSGVIKRGKTPRGFNLKGFPLIVRVRDNGDSSNDPHDAISFAHISDEPIKCYEAPDLELYDYIRGQVKIR